MASRRRWTRWTRSLLRVVGAALLIYVTLTVLLWWKQEALLFMPAREYGTLPSASGLTHEEIDIEVEPGTTIRGWFIPAPVEAIGTVLYFHGNSRNLSYYVPRLAPFAAAGFDSFSIDYEGYGASGGTPSETNIYRDADAAWNWLTRTKGVKPGRIVVWGYSLGGAAATWCASRHEVGAVVLESTFTTIPEVGANVYPWLPVSLVSRYQFANRDRVAMIRAPILIGHGNTDQLIPFEMGQELHRVANEPKRFVEHAGDHGAGLVEDPATWSDVRRFLEEAGFR